MNAPTTIDTPRKLRPSPRCDERHPRRTQGRRGTLAASAAGSANFSSTSLAMNVFVSKFRDAWSSRVLFDSK